MEQLNGQLAALYALIMQDTLYQVIAAAAVAALIIWLFMLIRYQIKLFGLRRQLRQTEANNLLQQKQLQAEIDTLKQQLQQAQTEAGEHLNRTQQLENQQLLGQVRINQVNGLQNQVQQLVDNLQSEYLPASAAPLDLGQQLSAIVQELFNRMQTARQQEATTNQAQQQTLALLAERENELKSLQNRADAQTIRASTQTTVNSVAPTSATATSVPPPLAAENPNLTLDLPTSTPATVGIADLVYDPPTATAAAESAPVMPAPATPAVVAPVITPAEPAPVPVPAAPAYDPQRSFSSATKWEVSTPLPQSTSAPTPIPTPAPVQITPAAEPISTPEPVSAISVPPADPPVINEPVSPPPLFTPPPVAAFREPRKAPKNIDTLPPDSLMDSMVDKLENLSLDNLVPSKLKGLFGRSKS